MDEEKQPAVYIIANRYRGTVYIGVTSVLWNCIGDHKNGTFKGFSHKYGLDRLVWYEHHADMASAIKRESRLKAWKRNWKIELIEKLNPDWNDLHELINFRPIE